MNTMSKLTSLVGASLFVAFASTAPVQAAVKPCCSNNGQHFNTSPTTCRNNGGRVVGQQYCQRGGYAGSGNSSSFSITLGNVVIGYSDGYYDRDRTWHGWRNNSERNWYQQNHRGSYYQQTRASDRNQNRRSWRDGKRKDWR